MGNVFTPQTMIENSAYATVLIQTSNHLGTNSGAGTGFIVRKDLGNNTFMYLLVTNKHVITYKNKETNSEELYQLGSLKFHLADEQGNPINKIYSVTIDNFGASFFVHPDPAVDLCAFPLNLLLHDISKQGANLFIRVIPTEYIPTDQQLSELDYMEEVFMVGYPNALSDELHNYPIIRRGVTATHPYIDFNGKKEFLADIPNFPGSSGSPLFLYSRNRIDKHGNICIGAELFYFLGIVYSVETSGIFVDIQEPTKLQQENRIQTAMNLAHVIKSSELFELLNLFPSAIKQNEEENNDTK